MVIEAFSEAAMFKLGQEYEEKAAVETAFQVQGAGSSEHEGLEEGKPWSTQGQGKGQRSVVHAEVSGEPGPLSMRTQEF